MPTPHVLYEQTGAIAVLTFNRPEARNAMTWEMYQALVDFCDRAEDDPAVRVLVLRGARRQGIRRGHGHRRLSRFRLGRGRHRV